MVFLPPPGSPLLTPRRLGRVNWPPLGAAQARATRSGAWLASGVCLMLFVFTYAALWLQFYPALAAGRQPVVDAVGNAAFAGGVIAFGLTMLTAYRPVWAPLTAPLVALAGGLFCGGLALAFESRHPGIAMQSIVVTTAVCAVLFVGYRTGLIQVTARFRATVIAATTVVAVVYLLSFVVWVFGMRLPVIHGAGWGGVLWTGFVAVVASLNLTLDFARFEQIETRVLPRHAEWYCALSMLITFVWLYVSILRLLQRVRSAGGGG